MIKFLTNSRFHTIWHGNQIHIHVLRNTMLFSHRSTGTSLMACQGTCPSWMPRKPHISMREECHLHSAIEHDYFQSAKSIPDWSGVTLQHHLHQWQVQHLCANTDLWRLRSFGCGLYSLDKAWLCGLWLV